MEREKGTYCGRCYQDVDYLIPVKCKKYIFSKKDPAEVEEEVWEDKLICPNCFIDGVLCLGDRPVVFELHGKMLDRFGE
jgi:hypothetical protein